MTKLSKLQLIFVFLLSKVILKVIGKMLINVLNIKNVKNKKNVKKRIKERDENEKRENFFHIYENTRTHRSQNTG